MPSDSDVEDINHPQRSARSPDSKPVTLNPHQDENSSVPASNPPPSQLSTNKAFTPGKPKRTKQKYMASSDSALHKVGLGKERTVVDLTMATPRKAPTRKRTVIRAIDRYIEEKLGDKLRRQEAMAVQLVVQEHRRQPTTLERVTEQNTPVSRNQSAATAAAPLPHYNTPMSQHYPDSSCSTNNKMPQLTSRDASMLTPRDHPLLTQNTRIKVQHPVPISEEEMKLLKGKRAVYRGKKVVTPFEERVRPPTQTSPEHNVVLEDYLNKKKYNPLLRPPSFRLDLRQYPPSRPSISRDASFDQKNNTIVVHNSSSHRKLTECDLKFPSRITSGVTYVGNKSEIESRYTSETTPQPPGNDRPFRRRKNRRHPGGGGGYIELHVVNRRPGAGGVTPYATRTHAAGADGDVAQQEQAFDLDAYMESHMSDSRPTLDTPADSIDASLMKEIYENLDDYLLQMNSRTQDSMLRERSHEQLVME